MSWPAIARLSQGFLDRITAQVDDELAGQSSELSAYRSWA